jgi:hypothetical protein
MSLTAIFISLAQKFPNRFAIWFCAAVPFCFSDYTFVLISGHKKENKWKNKDYISSKNAKKPLTFCEKRGIIHSA